MQSKSDTISVSTAFSVIEARQDAYWSLENTAAPSTLKKDTAAALRAGYSGILALLSAFERTEGHPIIHLPLPRPEGA